MQYRALLLAIALASPAQAYTPPRTADGKPDLQGVWANNTATPLERPTMLQGRALLTVQEVAALKERYTQIFAGDGDAAFGDAIFEAVLLDVQSTSRRRSTCLPATTMRSGWSSATSTIAPR